MNIQNIVSQYPGIVSLLFTMYGIEKPVNYETLAAAIEINSTPNGNPFVSDLLATIDGNNYDDYDAYDEILGLGKKGKAKRAAKREERGGYSRIGAIGRKIGIAKNKPARGTKANERTVNAAPESPLVSEANQVENPDAPKSKITLDSIVSTVGTAADAASNIINTLKGGGGDNGGGGGGNDDGGNDEDTETKKWYQKPLVLVGIAAGVLAVVGVIIAVVKSGGKTAAK